MGGLLNESWTAVYMVIKIRPSKVAGENSGFGKSVASLPSLLKLDKATHSGYLVSAYSFALRASTHIIRKV